ncbi:hypothetical protein [Umezawaea tangerina]|uniref:Uncharacterized protein n=1 Tax=Umezawaea tangerina TaxID=84725 RepID=A0A2T0SU36_9PSEU|nr:hypothetical protein [Umezawaea tangerina]PRY36925.1 hypothetical protein CLV43_111297 [Umezawaea tangerina]
MDYTLQLLVDSADLEILKAAQQNIILAKPVGGGSPNVAWLTVDPFPENTIEWTESYGLYASTSSVESGARIRKVGSVPVAEDGNTYAFKATNTFSGPSSMPPVPNGTFAVNNVNDNPLYPYLTFGLTQSATVGPVPVENAPISATVVPSNQSVAMTPLTSVWVWLEANLMSGTVITQVTSKRAIATFGDGVPSITLKYSRSKGFFVPATTSGKEIASESYLLYDPLAPDARAATKELHELVSST